MLIYIFNIYKRTIQFKILQLINFIECKIWNIQKYNKINNYWNIQSKKKPSMTKKKIFISIL